MTLKRELSYNIHGYCCIYSLFFQYPLLGFIAKIAMLFIPLSLSANPNSQLHQTDLRESFVTTYINFLALLILFFNTTAVSALVGCCNEGSCQST